MRVSILSFEATTQLNTPGNAGRVFVRKDRFAIFKQCCLQVEMN